MQLGSRETFSSTAYIPGIFKHQGMKLTASFQRQNPRRYIFGNSVSFPRGYTDMTAYDLNRLSVDYVFPIVYPDFDFFGLFYVKRIRGDLFADLMKGSSIIRYTENGREKIDATYRSYGAELYIDYHPFRVLIPLESGVRLNYLQNENRFTVEGLFSVNLGFF